MEIVNHIKELRLRILYIILTLTINFLICFYFSEELFFILSSPLLNIKNISFIYTELSEAFIVYIKTSIIFSILFAYPIILIQIWLFLVPALYKHEKKEMTYIFLISFFLLLISLLFCLHIFLPIIWNFFLSFENNTLNLQPKINQYLDIVLNIVIFSILIFEFPLLLFYIYKWNIIKINPKKRQYIILGALILGALISPPDIISQIIMASILFILNELIILLLYIWKEYN